MRVRFLSFLLLAIMITGCASSVKPTPTPQPTQLPETDTPLPTITPSPTLTQTPTPTPTLTSTLTSTPWLTHTPTLNPTPTLGIGSNKVRTKDGMMQVYIPAGPFWMGAKDDPRAYPYEKDQHQVILEAFWIDKTEVTNAMFAQFLSQSGNQSEGGANWINTDDLHTHIVQIAGNWLVNPGYEDYPVGNLTWYGARAYCEWAGSRLPSEAEWEKAARGDDKRIFPWGNQDPNCELVNYQKCSLDLVSVASYPFGASIYGAMDMVGNVWEWTNSLFKPYPYQADDGRENPSTNAQRVFRGGAYNNSVMIIRTTFRYGNDPTNSSYTIGFRCAN